MFSNKALARLLASGSTIALALAFGASSSGCSAPTGPADAPAAGAVPGTGRVTAFVGVTVLTMEPATPIGARLDDQTVLVRGDRIERIGPASRVRVPDGAVAIDGRSKFLLPGLIDMHVHLAHAEQLPLYVARGVTAVRNMWGAPMHLAWRSEIEEGRRLGPTIRTAGPIVDGKDPVHEGSFVALTPSDADRAVLAHVAAGYDFVKAYSLLDPAVFARLGERSRAARLSLVGHVPRQVGLMGALDAGELTIEHTNTFYDALQADDSPVRGKTDRASRQQWIDHVDPSKLEAIAARFVQRPAWACPTRVVMRSWEPKASQLARLQRPEMMKYVLPSERAVWRRIAIRRRPSRRATLARSRSPTRSFASCTGAASACSPAPTWATRWWCRDTRCTTSWPSWFASACRPTKPCAPPPMMPPRSWERAPTWAR